MAVASPARAAHIEIGFLTCKVAGGIGFVFGSSKELECTFKGPHGTEQYHGSIDRFGIDLGFTDGEAKVDAEADDGADDHSVPVRPFEGALKLLAEPNTKPMPPATCKL